MTDKPNPSRSPQRSRKTRAGQVYRVRNQDVVVPSGYLAVGHIIGVHGLHGELKIELYTDFPERFAPGVTLFMGPDLEEVEIRQVRPHKGHLLIMLDGINDRTTAEGLRSLWLFVDEADAAELEEGEYWIHDIIGLKVETDTDTVLGKVVDVLATGANDVYIVRPAEGINRGQEILLPAIADVILAVDLAAGILRVHIPEGLIDA